MYHADSPGDENIQNKNISNTALILSLFHTHLLSVTAKWTFFGRCPFASTRVLQAGKA